MDPAIEQTPEQIAAILEAGGQVIDCRTEAEWAAERLAGTRFVPMDQLSAEAGSFDSSRPLIFVCRTGSRSLVAAQAFKASGFDAWSMAGGIEQWKAEGRPVDD